MKKLRVVLIGVGSVVREIYEPLLYRSGYASLVDVVGFAEINEEAREQFAETHGIPKERRFRNHAELLDKVDADVAMINTPDHLHRRPTVDALDSGLDVLVPKPLAGNIRDCHEMIETARRRGRLLAVDFHKRDDPRIRETKARYQKGEYGPLQVAVFYVMDKLMVANPNHEPRFFVSETFAADNTPVSFLGSHAVDALLQITRLKPLTVRATGFKQKLPSLEPISVDGYDLIDTEIGLDTGAVAHIISAWHIPNTAHATTIQSARLVCRGGVIDLGIDTPGYREIVPDGLHERNPIGICYGTDGMVSGYMISHPGKLLRNIQQARSGETDAEKLAEELLTPLTSGFLTTLVVQGVHESLASGHKRCAGVVEGASVVLEDLIARELGVEVAREYVRFFERHKVGEADPFSRE